MDSPRLPPALLQHPAVAEMRSALADCRRCTADVAAALQLPPVDLAAGPADSTARLPGDTSRHGRQRH